MTQNQLDKDRAIVQAYLDGYAVREAEADRRRREEIMAYALASVRLEGFQPSAEVEAKMHEYIEGKITLDQMRHVCLK